MGHLRLFAALAMLACTAAAAAQGSVVTLTTTPSPLGLGQNRFDATVTDAAGRPIADAEVKLSLVMPADPKTKHPEMRTEGMLNNIGGGKYNGTVIVSMAGTWHVTVTAVQHGKTIGQSTSRLQAYAVRPASAHRPHAHTHTAAAALKNPVTPDASSVSDGAVLFGRHCASCHGAGGKGDGAAAAKLKSRPADLTDAEWIHGPSDGEIFTLIRDGAKSAGMKPYRGVLTDVQIWNLVNYLRSLSRS